MDWLPSNDIFHRLPNLFGDGILTEGMLNENVVIFLILAQSAAAVVKYTCK